MKTTRLKTHECPACHYEMDAARGMRSDWTPEPGDFSLCLNCGAINVYDAAMQLRRPTEAEEKRCLAAKMAPKILWARAEIRKRGPIPGVEHRRKKRPRRDERRG